MCPPSSPVETDPDGKRYINSSTYPPLILSRLILPSAPLGKLIARIDSGPYFPVGSNYTGRLELNGRLFLLYNDANWSDNTGDYHITVNITGPLPTPIPDALDIQIAEKKVTLTVVAGQLEKEKQRREKENQARELDKTSTAVASQLNALRTPLVTVDLATTPTLTDQQIKIKQQAGLLPTNTPRSTFTPSTPTKPAIPEVRPTQAVPIVQPTTPKEIPSWLWGLGTASLAGLAAYMGYRRGKWKNYPPSSPPSGMGGGTKGATGGGSNPNTGPGTAPNFGPAQPKNPEWIIGQQAFERKWQAAKSKLSPVLPGDQGDESGYILDRFKAGMNVMHEVSIEDPTNVPEMDIRVRAGIEYLIPEIWPNSEIPKNFFDPDFFSPEDLAKTIYIPEQYRNLSSFTKGQKREVKQIRRILLHALHPDLLKSDSDPKLQDSIDILLKQLNSAWPLVNKLLS